MKILLDENMPHKVRQRLVGHEVFTVAFMKWDGVKNGRLLENAAADGFDVMLTVDGGIQYQQNLTALPCSVIIIRTESNAMEHIEPFMDQILLAL